MSADGQQQTQQIFQQIRMLEEYVSDLSRHQSSALRVMDETSGTVALIKTLEKEEEPEMLVSIGPGVYASARITPNKRIALNVGSNVTIEKDLPYAVAYLEMRLKEIEVVLQDTAAKMQSAMAQIEQGRRHLGQLHAAGQKSG